MALRAVIITLLVTTLLSGCNLVNTIRMKNANDHLVANWPAGQNEAMLETFYLGEKPYVSASINGVENYRFMIDTGASMSYLFDTPSVKSLGLTKGYTLAIGGWGDEQDSTIFQTQVQLLTLAGVAFTEVNFAFLPVTQSKYFLRADEAVYDGVLGHDVLHHFSWTFDKAANQISISALPYARADDGYSYEFETFLSKISIQGELNFGDNQLIEQDLLIDTGSRHSLKMATALVENNDIQLPDSRITAVDFGLSGRTVHQRIRLAGLKLGALQVKGVKTNLIGGDFEDDYGVIGSAFLNKFVSVVDYHSEKLHLIPYSDAPFYTDYNLLGLELRKIRSQAFIVRYVFPQLPSAKFDFEEGDIIVSINGVPSSEISQGAWLKLSATEGEYEICRERAEVKCLTVTSKPIPGYSTPG